MTRLVSFILAVTFSYGVLGGYYDGYKVYRITPKTPEAVATLKNLEETSTDFDFWTSPTGVQRSVDIMVSPNLKAQFDQIIDSDEYDAEVFIPNVQTLVDNEKPTGPRPRVLEWSEYHTLEEINEYLRDLSDLHPNVELLEVGESYEQRTIYGVKLSNGHPERLVFIEANIHAREWITSAATTWILDQFLNSDDPEVRDIADSHDWIFVPVFNPDGFAFTHADEANRMWRKTRTPNFRCIGVDPNRNWAYHFGDGGASASPCTETYRGPEPFSEPETASLAEYIATVGPNLYGYISIHSYSQLLIIPYGHSPAHVENYDELLEVGRLAIDRLHNRYNTTYTVGNLVEILYVASGGSMDWVKANFGTRITYSYELRDTGAYGFMLPPDQIVPTAEETLDSLLTIFGEFRNRPAAN